LPKRGALSSATAASTNPIGQLRASRRSAADGEGTQS